MTNCKRSKRPFLKGMLLIFLCLFLTSCGFHLRGPLTLAPPLKTVYLQSTQPYGALTHEIRLFLKMSGCQVVETPAEANTILAILNEQMADQLIGINATQDVRQYNLLLIVTFQVTTPQGKVLLGPQKVTETRTLTIKAGQILAGSSEANTLYQQMRPAIAYDILSRLSSRQAWGLLMKSAP